MFAINNFCMRIILSELLKFLKQFAKERTRMFKVLGVNETNLIFKT